MTDYDDHITREPEERQLPHDEYIAAVIDALDAAEIPVADYWTSDAETKGAYMHLDAVITLDPSGTVHTFVDDRPDDAAWPHGLLLLWEWHTGKEEHWEAGPVWEFAKLNADGSNWQPTTLPMGSHYASPSALVEAARKVIARQLKPAIQGGWPDGWGSTYIDGTWEHADALESACEAWGADA